MKASELKVGDVINKPPFWPKAMVIREIFKDDNLYATVAYDDGSDSRLAMMLPMLLGRASEGMVLHGDIQSVHRDGKQIYPEGNDA